MTEDSTIQPAADARAAIANIDRSLSARRRRSYEMPEVSRRARTLALGLSAIASTS
jgi:hypothetical protein